MILYEIEGTRTEIVNVFNLARLNIHCSIKMNDVKETLTVIKKHGVKISKR